ncbi:MAG: hypothetical protein ACOVOV_06615, partial [Dolichospermum sp.]
DNQIMLGGSNNGTYPQVVVPGSLTGSSGSFNYLTGSTGSFNKLTSSNVVIGKSYSTDSNNYALDVSGNILVSGSVSSTSVSSSNIYTSNYSSFYNGNFVVNQGAIYINKNMNLYGTVSLYLDDTSGGNGITALYRDKNTKNFYIDSSYFDNSIGGGVVFQLKNPSGPTGNYSDVLSVQPTSVSIVGSFDVSGSLIKLTSGKSSIVCDSTSGSSVTLDASNCSLTLLGNSTDVLTLQNTDATHQIVMAPSIGYIYNPLFQGNDNAISSGASNANTGAPLTVGVKSTTTNGLRVTSSSTMLGAGGTSASPSTYIKSDGSNNTIVGQTIINNTLAIGKTTITSGLALDVSG